MEPPANRRKSAIIDNFATLAGGCAAGIRRFDAKGARTEPHHRLQSMLKQLRWELALERNRHSLQGL